MTVQWGYLLPAIGISMLVGLLIAVWWCNWVDSWDYEPPPVDKCPYCGGSGAYIDVPVKYWMKSDGD